MGKKGKSKKTVQTNTNDQYRIQDQTIIFSSNFNKSLDEYYQVINKCKNLIFEGDSLSKFNHPIIIPMNLTSITLPNRFNKPLILTPELTSVKFSIPSNSSFNSSIEWSKKLKSLILGYDFNKSISFPKYLMCFSLVNDLYEHELALNKYLKKLVLEKDVDFQNQFLLPKTLYELKIETDSVFDLKLSKNIHSFTIVTEKLNKCSQLPKNMRQIQITGPLPHLFILTPRVRHLSLYLEEEDLTNKFILEGPIELLEISEFTPCICENLQNGTKCVKLDYCDNFSVCNLPNSIHKIIFQPYDDFDFDDKIECLNIPKNITVEITDDG